MLRKKLIFMILLFLLLAVALLFVYRSLYKVALLLIFVVVLLCVGDLLFHMTSTVDMRW